MKGCGKHFLAGLVLVSALAARGEDVASVVKDLTPAQPYKGWVHRTTHLSQRPQSPARRGPPAPRELRATTHDYVGEGLFAQVTEYADGSNITLYSVPQREVWSYSRTSGELRVETLTQMGVEEVLFEFGNRTPTTLAAGLAAYDREDLKPTVTTQADGNGTRVEVVYFPSTDEQKAYVRQHRDLILIPRARTFWVNAEKLVTRIRTESGSGAPEISEITYGAPQIRGIEDLGVPATAKLVDNRVRDVELINLQTRLWERQKKGFGNYTALLTQYKVNADGKAATDFGEVTLYAVQDDKMLLASYPLLTARQGGRQTPILKEEPPGWPNPDVQMLLPALLTADPLEYRVWDGKSGWISTGGLRGIQPMSADRFRQVRLEGIVKIFWSQALAPYEAVTVTPMTTLLRDAAHPGLAGIARTDESALAAGNQTTGTTYWFDPARDDLPVESETETRRVQNGTISLTRTKLQFTEFAQLPGTKQWYAAEWLQTGASGTGDGGMKPTTAYRFHLQILPELALGKEWFTDPRTRVNAEPVPSKNNALP